MTCREESLAVGEPLSATAPLAQCWIVIEQPGSWGREALTESGLDPELGARLRDAMRGTGTRILLARHPDRPARAGHDDRRVWIAHTAPGTSHLRAGILDDPAVIAGWDLAGLAAGRWPAFGSPVGNPLMLICTHGSRDACCAVAGRPLLDNLLASLPSTRREEVWECSHLGGHRFAPNALVLPSGDVYGRLTTDRARAVLGGEEAGVVAVAEHRGRSAFAPPLQAAEHAIRELGIIDRDVLDVLWVRGDRAIPVQPGTDLDNIASMLAEVRHRDGRAWRVSVRQQPLTAARPESCGADAVEGASWIASSVESVDPWA